MDSHHIIESFVHGDFEQLRQYLLKNPHTRYTELPKIPSQQWSIFSKNLASSPSMQKKIVDFFYTPTRSVHLMGRKCISRLKYPQYLAPHLEDGLFHFLETRTVEERDDLFLNWRIPPDDLEILQHAFKCLFLCDCEIFVHTIIELLRRKTFVYRFRSSLRLKVYAWDVLQWRYAYRRLFLLHTRPRLSILLAREPRPHTLISIPVLNMSTFLHLVNQSIAKNKKYQENLRFLLTQRLINEIKSQNPHWDVLEVFCIILETTPFIDGLMGEEFFIHFARELKKAYPQAHSDAYTAVLTYYLVYVLNQPHLYHDVIRILIDCPGENRKVQKLISRLRSIFEIQDKVKDEFIPRMNGIILRFNPPSPCIMMNKSTTPEQCAELFQFHLEYEKKFIQRTNLLGCLFFHPDKEDMRPKVLQLIEKSVEKEFHHLISLHTYLQDLQEKYPDKPPFSLLKTYVRRFLYWKWKKTSRSPLPNIPYTIACYRLPYMIKNALVLLFILKGPDAVEMLYQKRKEIGKDWLSILNFFQYELNLFFLPPEYVEQVYNLFHWYKQHKMWFLYLKCAWFLVNIIYAYTLEQSISYESLHYLENRTFSRKQNLDVSPYYEKWECYVDEAYEVLHTWLTSEKRYEYFRSPGARLTRRFKERIDNELLPPLLEELTGRVMALKYFFTAEPSIVDLFRSNPYCRDTSTLFQIAFERKDYSLFPFFLQKPPNLIPEFQEYVLSFLENEIRDKDSTLQTIAEVFISVDHPAHLRSLYEVVKELAPLFKEIFPRLFRIWCEGLESPFPKVRKFCLDELKQGLKDNPNIEEQDIDYLLRMLEMLIWSHSVTEVMDALKIMERLARAYPVFNERLQMVVEPILHIQHNGIRTRAHRLLAILTTPDHHERSSKKTVK